MEYHFAAVLLLCWVSGANLSFLHFNLNLLLDLWIRIPTMGGNVKIAGGEFNPIKEDLKSSNNSYETDIDSYNTYTATNSYNDNSKSFSE